MQAASNRLLPLLLLASAAGSTALAQQRAPPEPTAPESTAQEPAAQQGKLDAHDLSASAHPLPVDSDLP